MNRRDFLKTTCTAAGLAAATMDVPAAAASKRAKRVLVLGIDGMDPGLLQLYIDEGCMPNFKRFKAEGDFRPLQTSMPPQSSPSTSPPQRDEPDGR